MCEYCGCQSLASIAKLTEEHDQVVNLIGEIRAAYRRGDVATIIGLCTRISGVLGPHTVVEEQGLFPAMAADFPEQIAVLEAEHRRIEAVLAEAADGTARIDATWPTRLIEVLALLRQHIFKEQDGVFPAALSTLSTAEWEHLDQVRDTDIARAADPILATKPGSRGLEPAGADRAVISAERPIVA
ncbi:MAG: hemerythrin HHE cation-binding protein [Pseudonocardiales bacterium]|nr:MAG: hemerythrin HHE cation-binding protein [Pseudonocardiales bacterium]